MISRSSLTRIFSKESGIWGAAGFALLIIVAGALRVWFQEWYHPLMVPDYDGYQYIQIARAFLRGEWGRESVNWTPLFPSLIALFSFLPLPEDVIGSYINIVLGSAMTIPIYYLVKRLFSPHAGFMAAACYALNPLIVFNNVLVMSETSYLFSLVLFGIVVINAAEGHIRPLNAVSYGLTGALVYLGRPEGIVSVFLLSAFVLATARDAIPKRKIVWAAIAFSVFAAAASPYLFFLARELGRFALSGKVEEGMMLVRNRLGIPQEAQGFIGTYFYDLSKTAALIGGNLRESWTTVVRYALPVVIFLPFFFVAAWRGLPRFAYILIFFLFLSGSFAGTLLFHVDTRYISPVLSILLILSGVGFAAVVDMTRIKSVALRYAIYGIAAVALTGFSLYKIYDQYERRGDKIAVMDQMLVYRVPGEWLRKFATRNATLVSTSTTYLVAYYGDVKFVNKSSRLSPEELVRTLDQYDEAYLYVNEFAVNKYYTEMTYLLNPASYSFKSSPLAPFLVPVYSDYMAMAHIYRYQRAR